MHRLASQLKYFLPAVVAIALVPATALGVVVGDRQTGHLTPPLGDPAAANGDSDNLSFSQDNRDVKLAAFDTTASNLVPNDANGARDVILFRRESGAGNLGGQMELASVSSKGVQANADSFQPRLDGSAHSATRCLVYESNATNLDPRDKTPDTDVFMRDTKRGTTTLVSLKGSGTDADIDGSCKAVVYSAGGKVVLYDVGKKTLFTVGRGTNPDLQNNGKGAAYERGGQIYYQAFQLVNRMVKGKRRWIWMKIGKEQLVSRSKSGAKGNGPSANPTMDDNGYYVAFESDATNLCTNACYGISADTNGVRDIFRRTLPKRPGGGSSAPTKDFMQMVSYSCGTATKGGKCEVNAQGNGASRNAFMTGAGENIVFESEATNLRESTGIRVADLNGPISDIYYWNFPRGRMAGNVSRESRTNVSRSADGFDAPATKPAASNRANYIGWSSTGGAVLDQPLLEQPTVPTAPCYRADGALVQGDMVIPPSVIPIGVTFPSCPETPALPAPAAAAGVQGLFLRFLGGSHEGHETN